LRGADVAKRAWPDSGMTADIGAGLGAVTVPVTIAIDHRDQVEHEAALWEVFGRFLPQATYHVLDGVGYLSPLEAPDAVAPACRALCDAA
jgi:pimeloyl-ACP methyl ester carboxylesterase